MIAIRLVCVLVACVLGTVPDLQGATGRRATSSSSLWNRAFSGAKKIAGLPIRVCKERPKMSLAGASMLFYGRHWIRKTVPLLPSILKQYSVSLWSSAVPWCATARSTAKTHPWMTAGAVCGLVGGALVARHIRKLNRTIADVQRQAGQDKQVLEGQIAQLKAEKLDIATAKDTARRSAAGAGGDGASQVYERKTEIVDNGRGDDLDHKHSAENLQRNNDALELQRLRAEREKYQESFGEFIQGPVSSDSLLTLVSDLINQNMDLNRKTKELDEELELRRTIRRRLFDMLSPEEQAALEKYENEHGLCND